MLKPGGGDGRADAHRGARRLHSLRDRNLFSFAVCGLIKKVSPSISAGKVTAWSTKVVAGRALPFRAERPCHVSARQLPREAVKHGESVNLR